MTIFGISFHSVLVHIEGLLIFNRSESSDTYIYAFFAHFKQTKYGFVYYRLINNNDTKLLTELNSQIKMGYPSATFNGTRAIVVTWHNLPLMFTKNNLIHTFQAIVVSDNKNQTYAIINYGRLDSRSDFIGIVPLQEFSNAINFDGNRFNSNVNQPGRFIYKIDSPVNQRNDSLDKHIKQNLKLSKSRKIFDF
jgi:hypothetical protein